MDLGLGEANKDELVDLGQALVIVLLEYELI